MMRRACATRVGSCSMRFRRAIASASSARSGQVTVDFTSERLKLKDTLSRIVPRPLTRPASALTSAQRSASIKPSRSSKITILSPSTSPNRSMSRAVRYRSPPSAAAVEQIVTGKANSVLLTGEGQIDMVYRHIEDAIRRLAAMPGQRVMVFISPGFIAHIANPVTRRPGRSCEPIKHRDQYRRCARVVHAGCTRRHQSAVDRFSANGGCAGFPPSWRSNSKAA